MKQPIIMTKFILSPKNFLEVKSILSMALVLAFCGLAGAQGEKGEKGDKGDKGDPGRDATVAPVTKKK